MGGFEEINNLFQPKRFCDLIGSGRSGCHPLADSAVGILLFACGWWEQAQHEEGFGRKASLGPAVLLVAFPSEQVEAKHQEPCYWWFWASQLLLGRSLR